MDHPFCRQTWIVDQEVTPGPTALFQDSPVPFHARRFFHFRALL